MNEKKAKQGLKRGEDAAELVALLNRRASRLSFERSAPRERDEKNLLLFSFLASLDLRPLDNDAASFPFSFLIALCFLQRCLACTCALMKGEKEERGTLSLSLLPSRLSSRSRLLPLLLRHHNQPPQQRVGPLHLPPAPTSGLARHAHKVVHINVIKLS